MAVVLVSLGVLGPLTAPSPWSEGGSTHWAGPGQASCLVMSHEGWGETPPAAQEAAVREPASTDAELNAGRRILVSASAELCSRRMIVTRWERGAEGKAGVSSRAGSRGCGVTGRDTHDTLHLSAHNQQPHHPSSELLSCGDYITHSPKASSHCCAGAGWRPAAPARATVTEPSPS